MLIVLATLHVCLVLGFTLRILLRDDLSPPARLAWFIVINIAPYFGIMVYFLFGEVDIGHRSAKRYTEITEKIRETSGHLTSDASSIDDLIDPLYQPAF